MFLVDFHRGPLPDLRLPYDFLWFCMVFLCCFLSFWFILIVGPRPIFGYHIVLHGFAMVLQCFWLILIVGPRATFA